MGQEGHDQYDDAADRVIAASSDGSQEPSEEAKQDIAPTGSVGLSKEDVQALRDATEITFVAREDDVRIVARKEKNDRTYGRSVLEREIVGDLNANVDLLRATVKPTAAVVVIKDATKDILWQTVARSLKENDLLTLHFVEGGDSDAGDLSRVGLTMDMLNLRVERRDGRGRGATRHLEFSVARTIAEPDATERRFFSF